MLSASENWDLNAILKISFGRVLVKIFHNNWSFQSCRVLPCSWINPASNPTFYSPFDQIPIRFSAFRQLVSIANINWEASNANEILVLIQL